MKLISYTGENDIATVYLAALDDDQVIEFVESVQPPYPRDKKWVLIISTSAGCAVGCPFCDAGGYYKRKLTAQEIIGQIDYLIIRRFPNRFVKCAKFKIQFARMGEPAFNHAILEVLQKLPKLYRAPGLMPSISSIAPYNADRFFDRLLELKRSLYQGRFQLQFSIHSTNQDQRDKLVPIRKWSFKQIASYGSRFFKEGDRKINLNFALEKNSLINPEVLLRHFDPDLFLIKITPLNPTYKAQANNLESYISYRSSEDDKITEPLKRAGYDVLVSIGELSENKIGSNCGQYVTRYLKSHDNLNNGYKTKPVEIKPETCIREDNCLLKSDLKL